MNVQQHQLLVHRDVFPVWVSENVRYADIDMQGHANNAVYSTYLEIGRSALRARIGPHPVGTGMVVAQQHVVFRRPVLYPGCVDIGVAVLRVGRTSLDLAYGIFVGHECMATALGTQVQTDFNGRPLPLSGELRTKLVALTLPVAASDSSAAPSIPPHNKTREPPTCIQS